jgi:hypothetical protein
MTKKKTRRHNTNTTQHNTEQNKARQHKERKAETKDKRQDKTSHMFAVNKRQDTLLRFLTNPLIGNSLELQDETTSRKDNHKTWQLTTRQEKTIITRHDNKKTRQSQNKTVIRQDKTDGHKAKQDNHK